MPFTKSLVGSVLVGGALALALGLAPAAEASPPPPSAVATAAQPSAGDDDVHASYTRRFTVTNLSSTRLQLLSVEGVRAPEDGHSPIGTIVLPGQSTAFEVTWLYLQRHANTATFAVLDSNGARTGTATATMTLTSEWVGPVPSSSATVTGGGTALADRYQITFLDAPGTKVDLPDTDPVAQGATLSSLCANSGVRCGFSATLPPEKILGAPQVVGAPVNNRTSLEQQFTVGDSYSVQTSHSVEISASATATVFKAVELNLTTTYGYSWAESRELSQFVTVTVAPKTRAWLEVQEWMIRTTGDFTITAGNTTWTIRGVQFLSPDPKPNKPHELNIEEQKLSDHGEGIGPVTTHKVTDAGSPHTAATP